VTLAPHPAHGAMIAHPLCPGPTDDPAAVSGGRTRPMTERVAFFPAPCCTAISSTLLPSSRATSTGSAQTPANAQAATRYRLSLHRVHWLDLGYTGPIMSSAGVFVTSHGRDPVP
jgi:hypothetical protein